MFLKIVEILRIITGGVYIMFLPGFILSLIIFKKISCIERLTYSIAISIAVVPIVVFWGYKLGFLVTPINILVEIYFLIILLTIVLLMQRKYIK